MPFSTIGWLTRLLSNCVYVLRHGHSHGRMRFLATYVRIEAKRLFFRFRGRGPTQETFFGASLEFFDYETFAVLFEEIYVGEMYRFSTSTADPEIVDLGANIGMALLYLKTLYPSCRVTAVEADPETFEVLSRNVTRNAWDGVRVVNAAASGAAGQVVLLRGAHRGGLSHSIVRSAEPVTSEAVIPAVEASRLIPTAVDLLKMDIEGAEDEVVDELHRAGALGRVAQILLEYHLHMTPDADHLGTFLATLESAGFGYQIRAPLRLPFQRRTFQSMLVYAYRK